MKDVKKIILNKLARVLHRLIETSSLFNLLRILILFQSTDSQLRFRLWEPFCSKRLFKQKKPTKNLSPFLPIVVVCGFPSAKIPFFTDHSCGPGCRCPTACDTCCPDLHTPHTGQTGNGIPSCHHSQNPGGTAVINKIKRTAPPNRPDEMSDEGKNEWNWTKDGRMI